MERKSTETRTAREIWEAALGELQIQVSRSNYRTWFEKTTGLRYQENQFIIGVPNTFVAEYLDKNQRSLIEKALIGYTAPDIQVAFQVNGKSPVAQGDYINDPENATTTPPCQNGFNPKYVFDYFIEGSCNRMARAAAIAAAQNPGHSYNPLFIYGGVGLGKTHLLHAIGHMAVSNRINAICVSGEQFTNEFINAIRDRKAEEFRNKYRTAGMLLIDDINFIGGKEQTAENFFHTFNELHNANRQIVITSDRSPKSMHLEERLRSRFEWGLIVTIKPPELDTRLAILKSKAEQKALNIDLEVLDFIAQQPKQNIRELEGSLNRVVAYAKLFSAAPTVELASRALKDIATREPSRAAITPRSIIEVVASDFQLSPADLTGQKRDKETVLARRVAMYLIRQETNLSLAQIGLEIGGRDASAVTNACKKIANDIDASPYLSRKIPDIQQKLLSTLKTN